MAILLNFISGDKFCVVCTKFAVVPLLAVDFRTAPPHWQCQQRIACHKMIDSTIWYAGPVAVVHCSCIALCVVQYSAMFLQCKYRCRCLHLQYGDVHSWKVVMGKVNEYEINDNVEVSQGFTGWWGWTVKIQRQKLTPGLYYRVSPCRYVVCSPPKFSRLFQHICAFQVLVFSSIEV